MLTPLFLPLSSTSLSPLPSRTPTLSPPRLWLTLTRLLFSTLLLLLPTPLLLLLATPLLPTPWATTESLSPKKIDQLRPQAFFFLWSKWWFDFCFSIKRFFRTKDENFQFIPHTNNATTATKTKNNDMVRHCNKNWVCRVPAVIRLIFAPNNDLVCLVKVFRIPSQVDLDAWGPCNNHARFFLRFSFLWLNKIQNCDEKKNHAHPTSIIKHEDSTSTRVLHCPQGHAVVPIA